MVRSCYVLINESKEDEKSRHLCDWTHLLLHIKKKLAKRSASLGHHVYDRYLYSSETAVPASVIVLCTAISCATLLVSEIIKKKKKRMHARAHSHLIHIHTLSLSHTHTRACARARTHTWITEKSQIK